jgi:hypothetical protein
LSPWKNNLSCIRNEEVGKKKNAAARNWIKNEKKLGNDKKE